MSANPIVTIAIPTFARNEILAANIKKLLPQLQPDVQVLIVDNASPNPVVEDLGSVGSSVRVVRNRVNLGGNGNILRCLELCETPWVMVLGDDDPPMPDMIANILADIDAHPHATIINYATAIMHRRIQDWQTCGRYEFLFRLDSFRNLLFVSSSVMHVELLRKAFSWASQYTYSGAPHLALLLMGIDDTSVAVFRRASLVDWIRPTIENRASAFLPALGLPTLLELPLPSSERHLLARHLAQFPALGSLLHQALLSVLFSGESRFDAFGRFLHALHRFPFRHAPFRRLLGWSIAPAILVARLAYPIVGRLYRAKTGRAMGPNNLPLERL